MTNFFSANTHMIFTNLRGGGGGGGGGRSGGHGRGRSGEGSFS